MGNKDNNNSGIGGGGDKDKLRMIEEFEKKVNQVQEILKMNSMVINQINDNHQSKIPDNIKRNVSLIRQLNNNLKKVNDLYGKFSVSFIKSMEDSLAEGAVAAAEQCKEDRKGKKRVHPD